MGGRAKQKFSSGFRKKTCSQKIENHWCGQETENTRLSGLLVFFWEFLEAVSMAGIPENEPSLDRVAKMLQT